MADKKPIKNVHPFAGKETLSEEKAEQRTIKKAGGLKRALKKGGRSMAGCR